MAIASPLVGGALMGLAASLLLWTHGKPAGMLLYRVARPLENRSVNAALGPEVGPVQ